MKIKPYSWFTIVNSSVYILYMFLNAVFLFVVKLLHAWIIIHNGKIIFDYLDMSCSPPPPF